MLEVVKSVVGGAGGVWVWGLDGGAWEGGEVGVGRRWVAGGGTSEGGWEGEKMKMENSADPTYR